MLTARLRTRADRHSRVPQRRRQLRRTRSRTERDAGGDGDDDERVRVPRRPKGRIRSGERAQRTPRELRRSPRSPRHLTTVTARRIAPCPIPIPNRSHLSGAPRATTVTDGRAAARATKVRSPHPTTSLHNLTAHRHSHPAFRFASLAALEDDQLQRLSYHFRSRDAGPGEAILTQGEKTTTLYFIRSGGLECVADRRGAELRLVQIGADSSCGEVAAITGNAMNYSVMPPSLPCCHTPRFPALLDPCADTTRPAPAPSYRSSRRRASRL